MTERTARPLQGVYAAVFIDAIYVKVRDGQVGTQPFYAAIGVDLDGTRDVLGLWAGTSGAGELFCVGVRVLLPGFDQTTSGGSFNADRRIRS